jgi:hypothetical protein
MACDAPPRAQASRPPGAPGEIPIPGPAQLLTGITPRGGEVPLPQPSVSRTDLIGGLSWSPCGSALACPALLPHTPIVPERTCAPPRPTDAGAPGEVPLGDHTPQSSSWL